MKLSSSLSTLVILSTTIIFSGCVDDPMADYPKNVSIEYRVTSTTPNLTVDVSYTNETGGDTDTGSVGLPYSKKFTDKVEFGYIISLSVISDEPGTAKLEILVDNKVVETQTFESASFIVGTILYQFE